MRPLSFSILTLLALAAVYFAACAARPPRAGPYQPMEESARDARKADALNAEAAAIMNSKPDKAERLLRDALTADLYHGPAHNNLGVVFLRQGRLYEAASEFEWAARMIPGAADPRMNLALTLERAGRTSEALDTYGSALEVSPEHIATMQALARLQVRAGRADERTPRLLFDIAMRGESEQWREWARREMSKRDSAAP